MGTTDPDPDGEPDIPAAPPDGPSSTPPPPVGPLGAHQPRQFLLRRWELWVVLVAAVVAGVALIVR